MIGHLPVAAIDTGLVLKVIEPIWHTKAETASRLRGRIEVILNYAKIHGYREGENPAAWRGHLDGALPERSKVAKVKHHAALPYREIPAFMADLRQREFISARALEFLVLTAARTGEVINAVWSEVDLAERIWSIPANRMKAGRPHRVPLSDRAVEILKALPREGDYVFIGAKANKPMSNMTLLELLRGIRANLTVHGFRSAFRDWAAEQTNFPNEVVEMALAHAIANKVESAYRRGELLEKRAALMQAWASYCAAGEAEDGKIIPLRAVR